MQQEELIKLLSPLKNNYFIEVETNCTIIPNESLVKMVDQWNVSPKTQNSGNLPEQYENKESYNFFTGVDNCYFKFVVENEEDLTEIQKLINKYNIKKDKVFLMPQATTKMEIISREEIVSKLAKNHKFRYSPRTHVSMWGNQRGK
jgi:organic radical activating enzyme